MPTKPNARDAIESLLTTSTSPGSYSCGSELTCPIPTVKIIKSNERGDVTGCASLSFPLDAKGIQNIKDNAQRAGVGLKDKTVVNLDVRTTYVHMICTIMIIILYLYMILICIIATIRQVANQTKVSTSFWCWTGFEECSSNCLTWAWDWSWLQDPSESVQAFTLWEGMVSVF